MQLSTFGAIMKLAMDCERQITDILEKLGRTSRPTAFNDLSKRILADSKKSLNLLERVRRESINEVILEPTTGLEDSDYRLEDRSSDELSTPEFGRHLEDALERTCRFYTDAASKISNPEAARAFRRLAQQKMNLRQNVKERISDLS